MFMSSDEAGAAQRAVTTGDPREMASPVAGSFPRGMVTGIDVRSLPPGTEVIVDTHNSRYHLVMLGNGSNARIRGGPYFAEETEARIEGSALAGSLLKSGWIGIGLFMEITVVDKRVVTSRVRSIVVDPDPVLTDEGFGGSIGSAA
jgi:hypothetical protein